MFHRSIRRLVLVFFGVAGLALSAPAAAVEAQANETTDCETASAYGGGAVGCYWLASSNLGPMPSQIYWLIDRFPDAASAEAARTLYGTVTVGLGGQVFLQTVTDNPSFAAEGGERVAAIGPLAVPTGPDLIARFMEVTLPASVSAYPPTPDGAEAVYVVSGSICVETPAGLQTSQDGMMVFPAGVPRRIEGRSGGARALTLVVHRSGESWADKRRQWQPSGLCGD